MTNLHRANGSDWQGLRKSKMNSWQKVAARTYGIVTLANFISLLGALVVLLGLLMVHDGHVLLGLALVAVGRLADLLDGIVAERTRTKSGLGELVDATTDKSLMILSTLVLTVDHLVFLPVLAVIMAHNVYITLLAVAARAMRIELHPSLLGKRATAISWVVVIGFVLSGQINGFVLRNTVEWIGIILFLIYLVTGAISSYRYTYQFLHGERKT